MAITDGVQHSYAIFIYECGDIQWGADMANGSIFARVGISVGGNILYSHSLSGTNVVDTIDCLNLPTSPWVNLIYDISLITPSNTSYESRPHTMSTISSSILNESSKPIASSRSEELFFTASAQRLMTLRLTESGDTESIFEMIIIIFTSFYSFENISREDFTDNEIYHLRFNSYSFIFKSSTVHRYILLLSSLVYCHFNVHIVLTYIDTD